MYRMGSVTGVNLLDGSSSRGNNGSGGGGDISILSTRRNIPNSGNSIMNFQNTTAPDTIAKATKTTITADINGANELHHQMNYCNDTTTPYSGHHQENITTISNGGGPRIFSTDIGRRQHHHITNDNIKSHFNAGNKNMIQIQTKYLPTTKKTLTGNNNLENDLEDNLNETIINDQQLEYSTPPPPPPSSSSTLHYHRRKINPSIMQKRQQIQQQQQEGNIYDQYLLWIITPVAASISLAVVVAALAGPQWLYTEEKLPNSNYNGTSNFNAQDDGVFITKYTKSSLWILCSALQGIDSYHCIKIDYFPKEEYRPDHHDSTFAIPYTVTRSSPFFLVSGIFLLISFFVFLIAICTHQNSLYYFTSGILFIVSGLLMFIGLIVYISIFKAEIGTKLRPKSTLQPPLFKYSYGQSFFLYVFGFISTEFVGVLNIFLFISLQQVGHHKTIPCFAFLSSQEKVKYINDKRRDGNTKYIYSNDKGLNRLMCRKHSIPTDYFLEHRYYFEKPQKCGIHNSQNLAKSLNELTYIEPSTPNFSSFDFPQEFPLTRSVSTSTEIFSKTRFNNNTTTATITNTNATTTATMANTNNNQQKKLQQLTITEKKNKNNQTNDSKESLNDICGLSRGILAKGKKSKDELFNEFCKRAGIRPKPKDIYYIEDNIDEQHHQQQEQDDENIFIVDSNDASLIKNRRNSFREPRKRNSISSLRLTDKIYQKSLFDLERSFNGGSQELWNNDLTTTNQYFTKNELHDGSNNALYQSRTLPRCFLKRNFDSVDFIENNNKKIDDEEFCEQRRRGGGGGVGGGGGGEYRGNIRRDGIIFNSSREYLRKSFDDINLIKPTSSTSSVATTKNISLQQQQQQRKQSNNNLTIQWPTAIPTSPSSFSIKSSAFPYTNNNGSSSFGDYNKTIPLKYTRGYGFDDGRSDIFDSFDLDEIERERRKSHASLLGIGGSNGMITATTTTTTPNPTRLNGSRYDLVNGTAV